MRTQVFFQMLRYLLVTIFIDIIAGNFIYHLLKVSENKVLDIFIHHVQMENKPAHISGSLIDHVCILRTLLEEFSTNVSVENIYFSDHNALRIVIEKNTVDFQMIS